MFKRKYLYERGLDGVIRRYDLLSKRHRDPRFVLGRFEIKQIGALASVLTQIQIAKYFGMSIDAFRRICRDDPEVMKEYERGKTKTIQDVGSVLIQKCLVDRHPASIFFYLKTRAGWKETIGIDQQKQADEEFNLKENADLSKLSDEDLTKLRKIFAKYKDENV